MGKFLALLIMLQTSLSFGADLPKKAFPFPKESKKSALNIEEVSSQVDGFNHFIGQYPPQFASEAESPAGHPKSPSCGHLKIPHRHRADSAAV